MAKQLAPNKPAPAAKANGAVAATPSAPAKAPSPVVDVPVPVHQDGEPKPADQGVAPPGIPTDEQGGPSEAPASLNGAPTGEVARARGTRALTVVIDEQTYLRAKTLCSLQGRSISGLVVEFLKGEIKSKLREELAKIQDDLA